VLLKAKFTDKVVLAMEALWKKRPTDSDEMQSVRQKLVKKTEEYDEIRKINHELFSKYETLRAAALDATRKWEIAEAELKKDVAQKEKDLETRYHELEKSFYEKVEKLMEGCVSDQSAKLVDRSNKAEAKVLRYDKMAEEIQELQAKNATSEREKVLSQEAKSELEHKFKDLAEEVKAFREGYDQLNADNKTLQTKQVKVQTDYDIRATGCRTPTSRRPRHDVAKHAQHRNLRASRLSSQEEGTRGQDPGSRRAAEGA
jgi:chromosome segregation ATPase